ncbi:MAG: hypothetical protein HQK50_12750 [Oligoflexia bacterium]|nr:hypothetical protein [Oligoflexia bacterium]
MNLQKFTTLFKLFCLRYLGVQLFITICSIGVFAFWALLFPSDFRSPRSFSDYLAVFTIIYLLIPIGWGMTYGGNLSWLLLTPMSKVNIFVNFIKLKLICFVGSFFLWCVLLMAIMVISKLFYQDLIPSQLISSGQYTQLGVSMSIDLPAVSALHPGEKPITGVGEGGMFSGSDVGMMSLILALLIFVFMSIPRGYNDYVQFLKEEHTLKGGRYILFVIQKWGWVFIITLALVSLIFKKYVVTFFFIYLVLALFLSLFTINNNFKQLKISSRKLKYSLLAMCTVSFLLLFAWSYAISYKTIKIKTPLLMRCLRKLAILAIGGLRLIPRR